MRKVAPIQSIQKKVKLHSNSDVMCQDQKINFFCRAIVYEQKNVPVTDTMRRSPISHTINAHDDDISESDKLAILSFKCVPFDFLKS